MHVLDLTGILNYLNAIIIGLQQNKLDQETAQMKKPHQIYFEPFKIKMVEPLPVDNPLNPFAIKHRESILKETHYNLFNVPAAEIAIDLLTDSGTGSMSQEQWSALMLGDESYAQATSFNHFEAAIKDVMSLDFHVIPTHQGRAAENILFHVLNSVAADAAVNGGPLRRRVLINSFFDTTAGNVCLHGPLKEEDHDLAAELLGRDSYIFRERDHNPMSWRRYEAELKQSIFIKQNQLVVDQTRPELFEHGIFGGNINLDRLEAILGSDVARRELMLVMLTVTNNTGGGLPVSLANLHAVRELIDHYCSNDEVWFTGLPPLMLFLDACRFAENAYFIQQYEPGNKNRSVSEIAREMFELVDGCTMSAKKDGMANIGGFIACRSEELMRRCWEYMVEIEGFYTYGGLAGRDLEAIAVGMREGVDDLRVAQRVEQVRKLWRWLKDENVPVKSPCGGHGVFVKGRAFWTLNGEQIIKDEDLPGHTLAIELYRQYGVRGCEIGTIMFGDYNPSTGKPSRVAPDEDYVRLAVPRRVYTDTHLEYVASALLELYANRRSCPWRGMRFSYRPDALPHFLSHFEPIPA